MNKEINILIADDHLMIRSGIKLMLEQQKQFVPVISEASTGLEVLEVIKNTMIDIIFLDLTMPEMDGLSVLNKLKSSDIHIPVIILTMHKDETIVKQALDLGALGYLLKNSGVEELVKAIFTVLRGERYFSNEVTQLIFQDDKRSKEMKSIIQFEDNLSKREIQIMALIVKEHTNHEIADILHISKRTIEGHRKKIMEKLNINSTVGLVKYALKNGYDF
ncbi:MAG: response regulator containing a CheY-like receiver domain and an DNA-binding domain [Crocinitomicaceae bacterium]|jgi:DNA-binding NarL/FixJ family response regulator|nr:response regulator containing a CheY-like receiver domain and an DNA-binding domain [Crocinitomicaceae bacterium]